MDDELTQQIMQRLAELPADVRQAVQSTNLSKSIQALGTKYQLHIDQIGELEDETLMAMLGFVPLESFEKRLASALHLPGETAKKIAGDVNQNIFLAVRTSLRQFTKAEAAIPKETHPADLMLSQKTVTVAPAIPPKPEPYKADPYREPVE